MAMTEPIRDKKQLKILAAYFLNRRQYRNYYLFIPAAKTERIHLCRKKKKWGGHQSGTGMAHTSRRSLCDRSFRQSKRPCTAKNIRLSRLENRRVTCAYHEYLQSFQL